MKTKVIEQFDRQIKKEFETQLSYAISERGLNTKEIIEYVKHFPTFMKQPNKIYHQYYKMFPDPKKTKIL